MAYVRVDLLDVNDNRPTFYPLQYAVSLSTQSAPGTSVVKVTANDPDAGINGRVTYRTIPGGGSPFFTLNKDTGGWPRSSHSSSRGKNFLWSHLNNYLPALQSGDFDWAFALLKTLQWLCFVPSADERRLLFKSPNLCLSLMA